MSDEMPSLKTVQRMNPLLLQKVNPLIFLSICELLASYCYVMERYLFDPDDLIDDSIDDLLHIRKLRNQFNKILPFFEPVHCMA